MRGFFVFTSGVALGLYAYLAALTRPIGDDYCISARLMGYNVFQAALYKYLTTSNRFSNEFVAEFTDLFGPRGVAVLAAGSLFLWLVGLVWLLYEAAQMLRVRWNFWTAFLLAELVALVSYYCSANLFQSVFWRPGVMTYYLPLVLFAFIFAAILRWTRFAHGGRPSLLAVTFIFFGAFFTGGLSETAGALHISFLGLALAAAFLWDKGATRRALLALIATALAGSLLAMFGMFITPANAIRLTGVGAPPLPVLILRAFLYGLQFLAESLRLLKQPAAFALGSGALIGFFSVKFGGWETPAARKLWIALILVPVLDYLLTVASFAPSAYGQSYPVERVRFPAYILFTMSLLLEGGLAGLLAAGWSRNAPRWTTTLALLVMLVASLYPLWITRNNLALLPDYQIRAVQWDQRDARIRELAASGKQNIVVWQLPGIANVKDLDTSAKHWVNYCAAIYYDVKTISAPQTHIPTP